MAEKMSPSAPTEAIIQPLQGLRLCETGSGMVLLGGKRKAVGDLGGLRSEGALRETRRMCTTHIAQNGEMSQSSA